MTTNLVHIVLYGVSFALILQVHPVSSMECGTVNFVRPVIIGGSDTVKGEWPFIVAIHNRSNYICGGTIISDRHILTAAHCIQRKYSEDILLPYEVVVRLGAYNLTNTDEKGAVQRTVSAIFVHPDWDAFQDRFDADIAILVLSENITFTDNIQPVCMPANGTAENMEGTVVGYGVRKSTVYAEIPRSISVGAVNHSHCFRKDNVMAAYSSERTFCGGNGDGSPDQGDSGSGYFYRSGVSWAQYGIVSMLRMNATGHVFPHAYHVYTNLTTFKDWIVETVNQTGGEVGEAKIGVTMTCDYQYTEQPGSAILPMPPVYICRVYNIDIQGNNFETGSFKGLHVSGKTKQDVDEIHFVNGTMSYLPSGFGLFFENIKHLTVGELKRDSGSLGTRVVRRFDLRYLRILRKLIFLRNDIEILHEDALWDLPDLQFVTLVENKLKVLANETFSKNRNLLSVEFQSNQLKFLPANLFKNNRLLKLVNFRNNFLKAIDDKLFRTNRGLKIVDFSFNLLETLPKRLFRNNLLLEAVNFKMNSLLSIDGDLFATNAKLYSVDFRTNRIESLPSALFQNNLQLRLAYFANNSIEAIDESLFVNNEKLFVVTFAFNRLKHLQRDVFKRALALHGLVFLGNSLKIIDIDFMLFENIGVIELDLNDCVSALYVKENLSSITSDTSFGNLEEFQNLVTRNCSKDRW